MAGDGAAAQEARLERIPRCSVDSTEERGGGPHGLVGVGKVQGGELDALVQQRQGAPVLEAHAKDIGPGQGQVMVSMLHHITGSILCCLVYLVVRKAGGHHRPQMPAAVQVPDGREPEVDQAHEVRVHPVRRSAAPLVVFVKHNNPALQLCWGLERSPPALLGNQQRGSKHVDKQRGSPLLSLRCAVVVQQEKQGEVGRVKGVLANHQEALAQGQRRLCIGEVVHHGVLGRGGSHGGMPPPRLG